FFSSRRRHTISKRDWSSDVCSSDLAYISEDVGIAYIPNDIYSLSAGVGLKQTIVLDDDLVTDYGLNEGSNFRNEAGITLGAALRSEERRVGKGCRERGWGGW